MRYSQCGTCLDKTVLRCPQRLVRYSQLLFESIELRVLEDLPPVSLASFVTRFGGLPVANFFICRRNLRGGLCVLWAHRAAFDQSKAENREGTPGKAFAIGAGRPMNVDTRH